MWNQAQTRHANSSTNLLCVFFASAAQIFSLLLRVKALNLYSFKVIIIIIILCLAIIIIILIVMIIIGDVGFRPNYRGAWPLCLLCPAYTLISTGNRMMLLMIMMMMLWMKMMMMIKFDVFQESSSSPSSLSFRSRTLYKFQPHLSAGDWYKIQIQIQV